MRRVAWWTAFAAICIVAACDLNPQPEVPAEQPGAAGQNGLGGTGGVLNAGGSAGSLGIDAGRAFDQDSMPDDGMPPAAQDGPADVDLDAALDALDASDADAND
jgi:hypothetical protein